MYRGVLILLLMLASGFASAQWQHQTTAIMGTDIVVEFEVPAAVDGTLLIDSVMAEMRRIEAVMSPYIESSELARLNQLAAKEPQSISAELLELLQQAQRFSELTDGAFDISFASAGFLYDFRQHKRPSKTALAAVLPAVNYKLIEIIPEQNQVFFKDARLKIDLGGIAKGYAVDQAIGLLKAAGVKHARVSAGGDSRVIGNKQGRPWVVGVRHPRRKGQWVLRMPLSDSAFSTSGDYERYFMEDDQRFHHIIKPETGLPSAGLMSVTILADRAVQSDALSTSVFVLGTQKGLALIETIPNVDAILIDDRGKVFYSSGLQEAE